MSHMQLKEKAFAQLLADGTVYSPNGTISTNFYTEFGVTRRKLISCLALLLPTSWVKWKRVLPTSSTTCKQVVMLLPALWHSASGLLQQPD